MRRISRWLLVSPWWFWVGGWVLAFAARAVALDNWGNALALATWIPLVVFTAALPLLLIRFIVRSRKAGGWRRLAAVVAGVLLVAFTVQRLISPGDSLEIENAAEAAMTSESPGYCSDSVTEAFMEQANKTTAPFADELCESYADYDRADSIKVTDVDVERDKATATVVIEGGRFDGQDLEVEFVKEDGDWKVNHIVRFTRFDRDAFETSYRERFVDFGSPPSAAECAIAATRDVSIGALERIVLNGDPDPWSRIAVSCDREGVERNLIAGFQGYNDFPPSLAACIEEHLRSASNAALVRLSSDVAAYGSLPFECDRHAALGFLQSEVGEDADGRAAACVIAHLHELPAREIVSVTYDDDAYHRLIESCKG